MELHIICFGLFLLLVDGARIQRDAKDDCSRPPDNVDGVRCCEMPRRHLWGKIKETIHYCGDKLRERLSEEDAPLPPPPPPMPGAGHQGHHKRYSFRRHFHDGCFMECIFEKEGFLTDGTLNKEAILERVRETQEGEDEWQATALAAVNKCVVDDIEIAANETCKSGSAEVVKCVFKHMFMECPDWLDDNEYCAALKEFYVTCPNGPPPDIFFRRSYHRRHYEELEQAQEEATSKKPEEL